MSDQVRNSKIYPCVVRHTRVRPVRHSLEYPLYMYAFDVDELPALDGELPLFGYNRFRPVMIRDSDYIDDGPECIRDKLVARLRENGWPEEPRKIILVTDAAYFGYVFNPVSFYYCFDSKGDLMTCVAEVNNTFGDRHLYVFPEKGRETQEGFLLKQRIEKRFHVSPFNQVEGWYECRFGDIRQKLDVHVDLYKDGGPVMYASVQGEGVPMTSGNHGKLLLKHPLAPWLTMPRIVWEAIKLMRKKMVMNPSFLPSDPMTIKTRRFSRKDRLCMKQIERVFEKFEEGALEVNVSGVGLRRFGKINGDDRPSARLDVKAPGFFPHVALGGDVGFGEAYVKGQWDSPDVPALLKFFARNRSALAEGVGRPRRVAGLINRLAHAARPNSLSGSRRNIEEHYDLGNDFFKRFLDPSMTYSCGIYRSESDSLEQAQINKLDAILDKAGIGPDHHVLEIGCGWGSFAVRAATRTGCRVTGLTISREQKKLAEERIRQAGLQDRINIENIDYREMKGSFDRIVSIEMLEAVGHKRLGEFFACCDRLLGPDGILAVQVITIPDQRYESYKGRGDWIQKHIFPGGVLPSLTALSSAATNMSELIVESIENIGPHYARTLADWRKRFETDPEFSEGLRTLDRFCRKWHYYFCYCEAGFSERILEDLQIVFTRPGNRSMPGAPGYEDRS